MEPNEAQRRELGKRIEERRPVRFATKKAAYLAADVNAQTWDNAQAGLSLRPDRLRAIVSVLWPETGGDWRLIEPSVLGEGDLEDQIRAMPVPDEQKEYMLRLIAEDRARASKPRKRGAS